MDTTRMTTQEIEKALESAEKSMDDAFNAYGRFMNRLLSASREERAALEEDRQHMMNNVQHFMHEVKYLQDVLAIRRAS